MMLLQGVNSTRMIDLKTELKGDLDQTIKVEKDLPEINVLEITESKESPENLVSKENQENHVNQENNVSQESPESNEVNQENHVNQDNPDHLENRESLLLMLLLKEPLREEREGIIKVKLAKPLTVLQETRDLLIVDLELEEEKRSRKVVVELEIGERTKVKSWMLPLYPKISPKSKEKQLKPLHQFLENLRKIRSTEKKRRRREKKRKKKRPS